MPPFPDSDQSESLFRCLCLSDSAVVSSLKCKLLWIKSSTKRANVISLLCLPFETRMCSSGWTPHQFCPFHHFQSTSLLNSPQGGHLFFKLDPGAIPASLQLRKRRWFIMARESENYRLQDSGIWCEGKPTMIAAGGKLWLTEDFLLRERESERARERERAFVFYSYGSAFLKHHPSIGNVAGLCSVENFPRVFLVL